MGKISGLSKSQSLQRKPWVMADGDSKPKTLFDVKFHQLSAEILYVSKDLHTVYCSNYNKRYLNCVTACLLGRLRSMGSTNVLPLIQRWWGGISSLLGGLRLVLAYLVVLPALNAKVWSVNVVDVSNHTLAKCGVGSEHVHWPGY